MLEYLQTIYSYTFMQKALIVGILVSLCSSLLGVTLVLKRYSMIGDGLSHVAFGSLCIALALNLAPLKLAIPVVVIAAFLLLKVNNKSKFNGDSAIALISSASMAIGIIAASSSDGLNVDVNGYMFGSIYAISDEYYLTAVIAFPVLLAVYILLYNRIFAITFDEPFAKATGTKTSRLNTVIALMTAITIVIGMKIMGAILISSLIAFPAVSSMRVFKSYKGVVLSSAILSVFCLVAGITLSFVLSVPAGACIVAVNAVMLAVMCVLGTLVKKRS